ncbi:MAG: DUF1549 and DUF1553 domain-containing protein [Bryobacter sp.]|nr:DUF1549 and DUF1553 domain-containing protein [Bryobacter sp.]
MIRQALILLQVFTLTAETVAPLGKYSAAERRHWAFQPLKPGEGGIDAMVEARLKKAGLAKSAPASKQVLVRRLYFDLTGLPPTPAEVAAFVNDKRPDAWAKLVDQLLGSPHYGERWGQHWLDVARFAETDGFEYDTHRQDAFRYRDYVIRAFQNDKPYDRFVMEQLAGDELAPEELETLIASGFNRLGPLRKNAGNQEVASSRNEVLTEMTNAVGAAFLGVTVGCARCHDHKFDPIRQSDYYRMQAYFAGTLEHDFPLSPAGDLKSWEAKIKPIDAEIKRLQGQMKLLGESDKGPIAQKIEALEKSKPPAPPTVYTVKSDMEKASPVHLLARGDYSAKGDAVGMRPLGVLLPEGAPELGKTDKPRLELAKWVVAKDNPLTARVMVNRIWNYHFGQGIVVTPNDFGRMGGRPSHPEILDFLAKEFMESGWSMKHVHRLILNSQTWRQASDTVNALAQEKDPENKLLWKWSRRRLEAEEIRDAMLAVAGNLNPKQFGPSVMVPIDAELVSALYKPTQWQVHPDPAEHRRRSVYLIYKRNLHLPMMEVFDAPDALVSCPRRETSTHAPQALELMNGAFANQQAAALAERLETLAKGNKTRMVNEGYRLVAGRLPSAAERKLALEMLAQVRTREFALALYNLNGFLYVD